MVNVRFWGNEQQVNTSTGGDQDQASVGALLDGGYVIAWRDASGLIPVIRYQRFDAEGRLVVGETILPNTNAGTDQDLPDVEGLQNGGFVISGRSAVSGTNHNSFSYMFNSAGASTGTAVIENGAANSSGARVLALEGTTKSVHAWADNSGGTFDVKISVRDQNGVTIFDKTLNHPVTGDQVQVAIDQDRTSQDDVFFAYTAGRSIWASYYDITTNTVLTENGEDLKLIPANSGPAYVLHDALSTANGDIVLYTDPALGFLSIIAFNRATATPTGAAGRVESRVVGEAHMFELKDHSIAVVYNSADGSSAVRTYCTIFEADLWDDGAALTNEGTTILVNTTTGSPNQFSGVDLAELADGRLVITWSQGGSADDNSGMAVMSQIIDPRGGLVSGTDDAALAETLIGNNIYNDEMHGYAGNDTMRGLAGGDTLYGGDGDDTLDGGRGDDSGYGGTGADTLQGGSGDDDLSGEAGNDTIGGGGGEDLLFGGSGNDRLTGGFGQDELRGGLSKDRFIYTAANEGGEFVLDFSNSGSNDDAFYFKGTAFKGSGAILPNGAIAAANFVARATDNLAQDGSDYFIYQANTDQLWYDPTGSAVANDQVLIATMQGTAPALTTADVVIY